MELILALAFPSVILASATCYFRSGNVATSNYKPCDVNATGVTGSHSSCCDTTNNDICLSSGLCLYPGGISGSAYSFFFADGCTDRNLADSSCQTFCPSTTANVQILLNCGNGNFCCVDLGGDSNSTACCGESTFRLSNGLGAPINQTTATGNCSAGKNTSVTAVGSVLGVLLALSLGAIAFLVWKLRRPQRGLREASVGSPNGIIEQVERRTGPHELNAGEPRLYELSEHQS
jgi:hypothetical protein